MCDTPASTGQPSISALHKPRAQPQPLPGARSSAKCTRRSPPGRSAEKAAAGGCCAAVATQRRASRSTTTSSEGAAPEHVGRGRRQGRCNARLGDACRKLRPFQKTQTGQLTASVILARRIGGGRWLFLAAAIGFDKAAATGAAVAERQQPAGHSQALVV